ncbi:MAG: hypothetical protein JSV68_18510, partial [Anaerolineaceae bacterium]
MNSHESQLYERAKRILFILLIAILLLVGLISISPLVKAGPPPGPPINNGIVHSVVKAPIVSDGDVAGAITDIVISLDRSLDPSVAGRTLLKGNKIKITFPDAFINTGKGGGTLFTPECGPYPFECSTGILLQGWPQHPIFPMFPPGSSAPVYYNVTLEGTHTLVYTALLDVPYVVPPGSVPPSSNLPGPGIKQMHLLGSGFVNPDPGFYDIQVMAQTGPGGAWESGTGRVHIVPQARPSINVTSVNGGPGNPNSIYQEADTNTLVDLPYNFFLWGKGGAPLTGVEIEMVNSKHALMRQGDVVVGHVTIDAPRAAKGQEVSSKGPSVEATAPVSGEDTALLVVDFMTGDTAGLYTVTF